MVRFVTIDPSLPFIRWIKPLLILSLEEIGINVSWRSITKALLEILPIFKVSPLEIPEASIIFPVLRSK